MVRASLVLHMKQAVGFTSEGVCGVLPIAGPWLVVAENGTTLPLIFHTWWIPHWSFLDVTDLMCL